MIVSGGCIKKVQYRGRIQHNSAIKAYLCLEQIFLWCLLVPLNLWSLFYYVFPTYHVVAANFKLYHTFALSHTLPCTNMRELGFIQSKHLFGALVCIFEPLKPLLLPKYYAPNLMQARSVLGVQAPHTPSIDKQTMCPCVCVHECVFVCSLVCMCVEDKQVPGGVMRPRTD